MCAELALACLSLPMTFEDHSDGRSHLHGTKNLPNTDTALNIVMITLQFNPRSNFLYQHGTKVFDAFEMRDIEKIF